MCFFGSTLGKTEAFNISINVSNDVAFFMASCKSTGIPYKIMLFSELLHELVSLLKNYIHFELYIIIFILRFHRTAIGSQYNHESRQALPPKKKKVGSWLKRIFYNQ